MSAPGIITGLDSGTLARLRALSETTHARTVPWVSLALGAKYAPWGNANFYQGIQYRVVGGVVELRGLVNPLPGVAGTDLVATLPTGARPERSRLFPVASATDGTCLEIRFDGAMGLANGAAPVAGLWISFDGVRFSL